MTNTQQNTKTNSTLSSENIAMPNQNLTSPNHQRNIPPLYNNIMTNPNINTMSQNYIPLSQPQANNFTQLKLKLDTSAIISKHDNINSFSNPLQGVSHNNTYIPQSHNINNQP